MSALLTLDQEVTRLRMLGYVIDAKSEADRRAQCVLALLELAAERKKAQESCNFREPLEKPCQFPLYHTSR